MAKFNPDVNGGNDPNYLNYSKETTGDRSFGTLFTGLGNLIEKKATLLDEAYKEEATEETTDATQKIIKERTIELQALNSGDPAYDITKPVEAKPLGNKSLVMADASSGEVMNDASNNVEIAQGGRRIASLHLALKQGKLKSSNYYAQLDSTVSALKAKYPGYTDTIDRTVQGITGVVPANAYQQSLASEYTSSVTEKNEAANDDRKKLLTNIEHLDQSMAAKVVRGEPYDPVEAWEMIRRRTALKSNLELKKAQMGDNEESAVDAYITEANMYVNRTMDDSKAAITSLTLKAQSGQILTPEEQEEATVALANLRGRVTVELDNMLSKPLSDDPTGAGRSYLTTIKDRKKIEDAKAVVMMRLDAYEKMYTDKDFGRLNASPRLVKAQEDQEVARLTADPVLRKVMVAKDKLGSFFDNMATDETFKTQSEIQQGIRVFFANKAAQGGSKSLLEDLREAKKTGNGKQDPKVIDGVVRDRVRMLTDPTVPLETAAEAAKSMFGEANSEFFSKISVDNQPGVFARLASPAVTKRMQELRSKDPALWDNYKNWAGSAFVAVNKRYGDALQEAVTSRPDMKVDFDENASAFRITRLPASTSPGSWLGSAVFKSMDKDRQSTILDATNKYNRAIATLKPILAADGGDVNQELKGIFKGMGVDTGVKKENSPWFRLLRAVDNPLQAFQDFNESVSDSFTSAPQNEDFIAIRDQEIDGAIEDTTKIRELIGKAEADSQGGYTNVFGLGSRPELNEMSIDEVADLQNQLRDRGAKSTAVGRYQFIRSTFRDVKHTMGLDGSEKFTPELQDRMAVHLLNKRGFKDYKSGKITKDQFIKKLSQEWAGLPGTNGRSYYDGDGLNKSTVSLEELVTALD